MCGQAVRSTKTAAQKGMEVEKSAMRVFLFLFVSLYERVASHIFSPLGKAV